MLTVGAPLIWTLFLVFVLAALLVDFLALTRQGAHAVSMLGAGLWSLSC